MAGSKLTPVHLSQSVAIAYSCGLFCGLYFVTLCFANRWLLFTDGGWKIRKKPNRIMVIVTNMTAVLLIPRTVLTVRTPISQMAFVEEGHAPEDFIEPPWDAILKCTLANMIALLADIVLMNRLWIVFGQMKSIMVFPVFLWLGGIVCTILQLFLQIAHIHDPDFGPYQWAAVNMDVGPGIVLTPFWASTTVLNAYCTGLLIWRLWGAAVKHVSGSSTKQLQFLIRVLMESGILYFVVSLAHFVAWFGKDNFAIRFLGTMNTTVIPIAFNLVLIRTAQSRAEGEGIENSGGKLTTLNFNTRSGTSTQNSAGDLGEIGMSASVKSME